MLCFLVDDKISFLIYKNIVFSCLFYQSSTLDIHNVAKDIFKNICIKNVL